MSFVKLERLKLEKKYELQELRWEYERKQKEMETQIANIEKEIGLLLANLDQSKVSLAESILSFSNGYVRLCRNTIMQAIQDLANDCLWLRDGYFGIKDYDRWRGQVFNGNYGYGPKHGYVVFSIGLHQPSEKLTSEQKEACIYYLYQLMENQELVETLKRDEQRKKAKIC